MAEKIKTITHKVKVLDEAGKPVKDENGKFQWKEVSRKYRVDADFVPTAVEDICIDFIDNYIEANDEGEWLVSKLMEKETYKKGEKKGQQKDISFVTLRSAFANKFFPEIVKGTGKKEQSFRSKLLAKYQK